MRFAWFNEHRTATVCSLAGILVATLAYANGYLLSGLPYYYDHDLSAAGAYYLFLRKVWPNVFPSWNDVSSEPMLLRSLSVLPTLIISFFVNDFWAATKLHQLMILIIGGFSMYSFAKHYRLGAIASFVAALAYIFSLSFAGEIANHLAIAWQYALIPLACASLDSALVTGAKRSALGASIICSAIVFWFSPDGIFVVFPFLLLFAIGRALSEYGADIARILRSLSIVTFVCLAAAAIGMFPIYQSLIFFALRTYPPFPYRSSLFSRPGTLDLGVSRAWSDYIYEALSFQQKEIVTTAYSYGSDLVSRARLWQPAPELLLLGFLPVLLASLALIIIPTRWNRRIGRAARQQTCLVQLLAVLSILSLLISMGPLAPYPFQPFTWAWELVPYFNTLQTPTRFLQFATLGVSVLIGIFVELLAKSALSALRKFPKLSFERLLRLSLMCVLLVVVISSLYLNALLASAFGPTYAFHATETPPSLLEGERWSMLAGDSFRVADLSVNLRPNTRTFGTRGLWNLWPIVLDNLEEPYFGQLLGILNIKYVLYDPLDTTWSLGGSGYPRDPYRVFADSNDFKLIWAYEPNLEATTLTFQSSWFPMSLGQIIAESNGATFYHVNNATFGTDGQMIVLTATFDANALNPFVKITSKDLHFSTDEFRRFVYRMRVDEADSTRARIVLTYNDGSAQQETSSFMFGSPGAREFAIDMAPNKTLLRVEFYLEPKDPRPNGGSHSVLFATPQFYVFENLLVQPRIYEAPAALVLGSTGAYLAYSFTSPRSNTAFIFANQLDANLLWKLSLFQYLIVQGGDPRELLIPLLSNYKVTFPLEGNDGFKRYEGVKIADVAMPSYGRVADEVVYSDTAIESTAGTSTLSGTVNLDSAEEYSILVRYAVLGSASVSIGINGEYVANLAESSGRGDFKLHSSLLSSPIQSGQSLVTVAKSGPGTLFIDSLLVVPTKVLVNAEQLLLTSLSNYDGKYQFILQAARQFETTGDRIGWEYGSTFLGNTVGNAGFEMGPGSLGWSVYGANATWSLETEHVRSGTFALGVSPARGEWVTCTYNGARTATVQGQRHVVAAWMKADSNIERAMIGFSFYDESGKLIGESMEEAGHGPFDWKLVSHDTRPPPGAYFYSVGFKFKSISVHAGEAYVDEVLDLPEESLGEFPIVLSQGGTLETQIFIPRDSEFRVSAMITSSNAANSALTISVDDVPMVHASVGNVNIRESTSLGILSLNQGVHTLKVVNTGEGEIAIRAIALTEEKKSDVSFEPGTTSYESLGPGDFTVNIDSRPKSILVLTETFVQGWRCKTGNSELVPYPVHSTFLGFFVESGRSELGCEYNTPLVGNIARIVSVVTLVVSLMVLSAREILSLRPRRSHRTISKTSTR